MQTDVLTTVHHALSEAQHEARGPKAMPTYTFRMDAQERLDAEDICERHGTSLSAYLRSCVRLLPKDYTPSAE